MKLSRPLKLIVGPSEILETYCRPSFCIPEWVIPEMFALLREHRGCGLAAPQVGIDARLFITSWGAIYINPVTTWLSDRRIQSQESCLSFPGIVAEMTRHLEIEICGRKYSGAKAVVLQHELSHLNGFHIAMNGAA